MLKRIRRRITAFSEAASCEAFPPAVEPPPGAWAVCGDAGGADAAVGLRPRARTRRLDDRRLGQPHILPPGPQDEEGGRAHQHGRRCVPRRPGPRGGGWWAPCRLPCSSQLPGPGLPSTMGAGTAASEPWGPDLCAAGGPAQPMPWEAGRALAIPSRVSWVPRPARQSLLCTTGYFSKLVSRIIWCPCRGRRLYIARL